MVLGLTGVGLVGGLAATVVDDYLKEEEEEEDARLVEVTAARFAALITGGGACWWFLELGTDGELSLVDAIYGSAIAATTVGLGDVAPVGDPARLFVGVYALLGSAAVALAVGDVATAPLEAARRRARADVSAEYGESLSAETLAELANGEMVTALGLSLDPESITRDEFSLLLLLRQGVITPSQLGAARARFDLLDADGNGVLDANDFDAQLGP